MHGLHIHAANKIEAHLPLQLAAPLETGVPRMLRFGDRQVEIVVSDISLRQAVDEEEMRLGTGAFNAVLGSAERDAATRSLIHAVGAVAPDDVCREAIVSALVVRALALCRTHAAAPGCEALPAAGKTRALLPKWRLKRVLDYVDAHLDERVTLAELAEVAGLSRMYFAAQFRRSTGVSPRGYLMRRRVERAQELMRDPNQSLAQIALTVGFGTQPHFTTVFKHLVGTTPHRWRQQLEQPSRFPVDLKEELLS